MINKYLHPGLQSIADNTPNYNEAEFLKRAREVEHLLHVSEPIVTLQRGNVDRDRESLGRINDELANFITEKIRLDIGKYLLSDIGGYNRLSNEEIVKIFQFELEILNSVELFNDLGHRDLTLIEDLIFLGRMLDLSAYQDGVTFDKLKNEFVIMLSEGRNLSQEEFKDIEVHILEGLSKVREEHLKLVGIELQRRKDGDIFFVSKVHELIDDVQEMISLEEEYENIESIYKEYRKVLDNAIGYNNIYGIPLRILKNVMLSNAFNLYQNFTVFDVTSSEYSSLFTDE